jgi:uncharacterized protein
MAVPLVKIQSKNRPRWEFLEPIKRRDLDDDRSLLIHPRSGAWIIVETERIPVIETLMQAAREGLLDSYLCADSNSVLHPLWQSGLLYKDGSSPWSDVGLDHSKNKVNTLILKMVGYCNLACTYCYDYNHVTYRNRLSLDTAKAAISQAFNCAGRGLNILFHGGEPLLAFDDIEVLVPFARRIAESLDKHVEFSVQTNGTQFRPEVLEFLLKERFSIGLSLDGVAAIDDVVRIDHAGKGQHAKIEQVLKSNPALLNRVGVLTTITRYNVNHLVSFALYLQDFGIRRWDTTLFQAAGRGLVDTDNFAPMTGDLISAYLDLLDAVEQGKFERLEVRPILHYLRNVLSSDRRNMCLRNHCGAANDLVTINVDGTIDGCDCIKNPNLRLGSMASIGIESALANEVAQSIRKRSVSELTPCQSCDWQMVCGGTCLAQAGELDAVDEVECQLSMAIFPEIFRRLAKSDRLQQYAELFH